MSRKTITIVAFGDSLTEVAQQPFDNRWPTLLHQALQAKFLGVEIKFINSGMGGHTTREGMARIESDVLYYNPDIVLVEFCNDVTPEEDRHVPYDEYTANLDWIRAKIAERANGRTVLLVQPPVIDAWHTAAFSFLTGWRNGGQDAACEHYRKLVYQLAKDRNLPVVPIDKACRSAMAKEGDGEYVHPDGCHLTDKSNRLIAQLAFDIMVPEIEAVLRARK